jgi:hypothetical protein
MTTPTETVSVETATTACDGGTQKDALGRSSDNARALGRPSDLGHPEVYLDLGPDGRVQCPYCSRLFVLKPGAAVSAHH